MRAKQFILSLSLLLFFISVLAQPKTIGLGWAKNSVNSPVFRKNAVVSHNGIQYVAFYDSSKHVVLAKRKLGSENWQVNQTQYTGDVTDAHCSISITVDDSSYIHVAWDHHNDTLRYCRGVAPGSLNLTEKMSMVGDMENDVTYPEFFKLPTGDLIFIYRYGISGNGNMVMNKYLLKEKKWIRLHKNLIDGQGERNAYWQTFVDAKGTIHISWVWRETWDVATNHDMCYAKSTDGGISWEKSTGEKYSLPITAASAEYVSRIPQNSELINQTSMYADKNGIPYIATYFKPQGKSVPQYHLIYFNTDSAKWVTQQISNRKTPFSLGGGGTKKIPISRPQIVVKTSADSTIIYLIYRDMERDSKVSVNVSTNKQFTHWKTYDLSSSSVGSWEPNIDYELWKDSYLLDIFVQKMGQGDGENLETLPTQPVHILRMSENTNTDDSFSINYK